MQSAGLPFTKGVCVQCRTSDTGSQAVARDLFSLAPEGFLETHKPRASETSGNSILQPRGSPGPTLPPQTGRAGNGTSRPRLSGDQRPLSSPVIIQAPGARGSAHGRRSSHCDIMGARDRLWAGQHLFPAVLLPSSDTAQTLPEPAAVICWTSVPLQDGKLAEGRAHSASLTSCLGSDTACAR